MFFGDAKVSCDTLYQEVQKISKKSSAGPAAEEDPSERLKAELAELTANFPEPVKTLGFVRPRKEKETRVPLVPATVPKVRQMGLGVVMENGAGVLAGHLDAEYKDRGATTVPSNQEVFQMADIV